LQARRTLQLNLFVTACVLAASLVVCPSAHALPLSATSISTLIHVEDPALCQSNASVPIKELSVYDSKGKRVLPELDKVPHGTQLDIMASLSSHCYRTVDSQDNYPFTTMMEVRDSDGITIYLAWQIGSMKPWTDSSFGSSWTPEKPGEYMIRAFSMGDLHSTSILSQVLLITITVV
jgi:hypothetical protein